MTKFRDVIAAVAAAAIMFGVHEHAQPTAIQSTAGRESRSKGA